MPSNVIPGTPTQVMPLGLMSAFSEQRERPILLDTGYTYGESTRYPLTMLSRSLFKVQRPLTRTEAAQLDAFYTQTMDGRPFYFYNLRETQPIGSYDPTGANPVGRYTVVWDGSLSRAVNVSRREVVFEYSLREVTG